MPPALPVRRLDQLAHLYPVIRLDFARSYPFDTIAGMRGARQVKLERILGYRLDMVRCAALRSIHRLLSGTPFRPADTTALLLVKEHPGCDQTMLGRALAANRSVGMKVAARLEALGLLERGEGRDRRSKGLFLTPEGEVALADLLARHHGAERILTATLTPHEHEQLLKLLAKVEGAVLAEEAALSAPGAHAEAKNEQGQAA
jgi:DNA-binding MarR family transcriptional regulator